jgi:hypothetical protein
MANARWIFSSSGGGASFYRIEDNIYAPNGRRLYWVSGTWWHSSETGATYFESGDWIYSKDGKASFYYGS